MEVFFAEMAFGLDAAEFIHVALEDALGVGAGAVDGILECDGGGIFHGVECGIDTGFDEVAAAETPGCAGNL